MSTEIVVQQPQDPYLLSPVMNIHLAKQRLVEFQTFVSSYLQEGEDFGKIPGAPKPILFKPGADKLCELYGLADDYDFIQRTEDFDKALFDYTIKCVLTDRRRGCLVSTGLGNCNSMEAKYRWRDSKRLCPQCGKEAIIKGKEEYGGGWLCFSKKGGCGAKFSETDQSIVGQTVGRTANEDVADLKNTILKMAKKRAKVDAVLSATRSSGIFTQDLEDMPHAAQEPPPSEAPPEPSPKPNGASRANARPVSQEDIGRWKEEFLAAQSVVAFNRQVKANMLARGKGYAEEAGREAKRRGYTVDRMTHSYFDPQTGESGTGEEGAA
jgi:hypothetical protein